MTGNLDLFSSLDTSVKTDVTLGNNVQVTVLGKGTVDITVRSLVIMHMNAGRNNITKEDKAQVSQPAPTLQQV